MAIASCRLGMSRMIVWAGTMILISAFSCDTGQPPPQVLFNQAGPSEVPSGLPQNSSSVASDVGVVGANSTAVLYQAKNGPGLAQGPVSWVNGNVNIGESHYLEGHSIPYRIVMHSLPTDGTEIELVIGYDVKRNGKHAVSYLTHYQRLDPHEGTFGHESELIDPLLAVAGAPATFSTLAIPEPRANVLVDCLPGELEQPAASFSVLNSEEKVMTLYGGQLLDIAYQGTAPDLEASQAEEIVTVRFTASSETAVLAWGGQIANRSEFGCEGDPQSAGGSGGSPYVARLKGWSLNQLASQTVTLNSATVFEPAVFCEVTGPMPVCPNSTDNIYSVNVTGDCEGPAFYWWHVLGDGEIVGSDEEPTVNVTAGASGTFLVFVTVFCADCHNCEPVICCAVVNIVPPAEAGAGPDITLCPPDDGPTCFDLTGTAVGGVPSWSVVTQPPGGAGCNVTITDGDTLTPSVCFPEGCSGSATLELFVGGKCDSDTDEVVLTVLPASTANAGPDASACPTDGQTCFNLSGSGSNGTPSWAVISQPSPGSVTITNGNTYTPTVCFAANVTGSATLELTVAGSPPCPASDRVVLTVGVPAVATAGPDQSLCPPDDGPTCFNLAGSGTGGTPSWSVVLQPGGGSGCNVTITGGSTFSPTVCFPEGCTGSATLRLTVQGDPICPPDTDDLVLTVVEPPDADAGPDDFACPTANQPTCFGLSGTGNNGTPSWSVVSQPSPGSVTIQNGNTFTPTVCFSAGTLGSATLRLTVTGNSLCPPATDDVVLTVQVPAEASAGADQSLCPPSSGPTCFSLTGTGSGGAPSWTVVTQPPGGGACNVTITGGSSLTPTVCFPAGCTGSATIRLTVAGDNNCPPDTDDVVLTVVEPPNADAGPDDEACPNQNGPTCFNLAGSGDGTPSWSVVNQPSPGSVTIQNGNTYSPTVCFASGVLGTATIRLSVTGNSLCPPATDDVILVVGESDLSCSTDTAVVAGVVTGSISGGTAPYSCSASFGSAGWVVLTCEVTGNTFEVTYTQDGGICTPVPTVTIEITDSEGCVTECVQEIPCPQGCVAESIVACECPDNPVTICASPSGGLPPFTFDWNGPKGIFTEQCITVDTPGIYTATVTDGNGLAETCCSAVVNAHIHGPSPCPNETGLEYEVHFELPGGTFTPNSFSWEIFGQGTFCGATNGDTVCVDAGASGVFTVVANVTGTITFACEGTTQSLPISGTCALALVIEEVNCP